MTRLVTKFLIFNYSAKLLFSFPRTLPITLCKTQGLHFKGGKKKTQDTLLIELINYKSQKQKISIHKIKTALSW